MASPAPQEAVTPPPVHEEESKQPLPDEQPVSESKEEPAAPLSPPKAASEDPPAVATAAPEIEKPAKPAEPSAAPPADASKSPENKLFVVETHHETEEVIERLLDVKGLEQGVSGLWGWMSGSVAKVAEQATKVAKEASVVAEKASQQASIVAENVTQQASIVAENVTQQASIVAEKATKAAQLAEQQAKDLAAQVSKTMEDKSGEPKSVSAGNLPWDTAHPERRAEARDRIMKLSMDDHTFTVPPPKEANYIYDAAAREAYAARMLDTDALLSAKRFKLVPKAVDEHEFWRNYFYRVDLILNALGVPVAEEIKRVDTATSSMKSSPVLVERNIDSSQSNTDLDEEMRKEIAQAEASHLETVKDDENFDMLDDDLEFDEDDPELEKNLNELNL